MNPVRVLVDGRPVQVPAGCTVAAACARAVDEAGPAAPLGPGTRRSVSGEARHAFCGMGVCGECRVEIDGRPHRPGCQVACEEGMSIRRATDGAIAEAPPRAAQEADEPATDEATEVVIVGAGPAGLAAAEAAARAGARVIVLDAAARPGGNVWRATSGALAPEVGPRLATLEALGVRCLPGTRVAWTLPGQVLLLDTPRGPVRLSWQRLVIATGARERLLPFPGSTRPGVFGAGGLQALAKGGWPVRGRRVVLAGTGPLLLASAATLRRLGAEVVAVVDEAPAAAIARFVAALPAHPGRWSTALRLAGAVAGRPFFAGWRVVSADAPEAGGPLRAVTLADARGRRRTLACDLLAAGWGLVPQVELAVALGCATHPVRGETAVRVDAARRTSVETVYAAGEPTGIAGVEAALASGALAGRAAARSLRGTRPAGAPSQDLARYEERRERDDRRDRRDRRALARAEVFADLVARRFPSPLSLAARWRDDTLVCRCEDVPWSALRDCPDGRSARLAVRCGMGHCQGRLCQDAFARRGAGLLNDPRAGPARPPLFPIPLGHLLRVDDPPPGGARDDTPTASHEETR